MPAGRPQTANPEALFVFAHLFYWDFRALAQGHPRRVFDPKEYARLAAAAKDIHLSEADKSHLRQYVDGEIRAGRVKETDKPAHLRDLEETQLRVKIEFFLDERAELARKELKVPGEPQVIGLLLRARTPGQVRKICNDAYSFRTVSDAAGHPSHVRVLNWPISGGSVLPMYLSQHAAEFIAARHDRRFPKSGRPTSELKQLWFLSRALAGALFGVKARTAINLVGSQRPERIFEGSRAGKAARKKRRGK